MKILVPIKRVIDPYVKVRVKSDGSGVEDNKMSINPFDEIAVEEALRIKEAHGDCEITVVSIGDKSVQETLRHALALGADNAIQLNTEQSLEPLNIAKLLKHITEKIQPQLVLMGKQTIDGDNNQTGQMLSALLGWSQATFASKLTLSEGSVEVTREIDGGLETIQCQLPAVVTTDLRLNEPRYASLPNIMKAKRKPLEVMDVNELPVALKAHTKVLSYQTPPTRQAGEILDSVDVLFDKLKNIHQIV